MSINEENRYINLCLLNIYDKISNQATLYIGVELFRQLLKDYISENQRMNYILSEIYDYSRKLKGEDKKEPLTLLPIILQNKQGTVYLSKILNIIAGNITTQSEHIFEFFGKIFEEIVLEVEKNNNKTKENTNVLKNFCFYYLNQSTQNSTLFFDLNKCYQICGFVFLSKLILNSRIIQNDINSISEIMQLILSYFCLLSKRIFYAKNEMLKCLLIVILKIQKEFYVFAKETLNQIFLLLKQNLNKLAWESKKILLEIMYNIIIFCPKSAELYYDEIVSFAKQCKVDKIKEVRMISLSVLKVINDLKGINVLYSSQGSDEKNKFGLSIKKKNINKSQSFRSKTNYNDKFVFVEKKIELEPIENSKISSEQKLNTINNNSMDSNKIFEQKIKELKLHMNQIESMQSNLFNTVNKVENNLKLTIGDFNKRLNKIDDIIQKYKDNINETSQSSIMENRTNDLLSDKIESGDINELDERCLENDEKMLNFFEKVSNKNINNISNQLIDDSLSRLISLYNINKFSQKERYKNVLGKIIRNYNEKPINENTLIICKSILSY